MPVVFVPDDSFVLLTPWRQTGNKPPIRISGRFCIFLTNKPVWLTELITVICRHNAYIVQIYKWH